MQIERIDHIVLKVKSIAATCAFYQKNLGMDIIDLGKGRKGLTFGQQKINLYESGNEPVMKEAKIKHWNTNICFITTTPVEEVKANLERNDVRIILRVVPKEGALGSIQSIYFQDPDENLIEVANYL